MGPESSSFTGGPEQDTSKLVTWPMSATFIGDYQLETSTDRKSWTLLMPKPTPANGRITNIPPAHSPKHYVRLVITPN